MNAVEHRLTQVVKDLLIAHKPAEVPETFGIRAAHDTDKVAKPYTVASAEDGTSPHPKMRKMNLLLTSHLRVGEGETAPDMETHQRFVNVIEAEMEEFAAALLAVQLRLRKFVPGATGEEIENGRATASATVWTVWLQIMDP